MELTNNSVHLFDQSYSGSDWLNLSEAANYLRVLTRNGKPGVMRLRNLVNKGRIPFYKPFGRLMFKRSELQKMIETSRQGNFNGNSELLRQKRRA